MKLLDRIVSPDEKIDNYKTIGILYPDNLGSKEEEFFCYSFLEKIIEDLQWSKSKIERTRVSLQKKGYLLIRRLPRNDFIYYIGKPAEPTKIRLY